MGIHSPKRGRAQLRFCDRGWEWTDDARSGFQPRLEESGFALPSDLLPEYFHSTTLGTDIVNGRTAILLECSPRRGAKPKGKEAVKGMQFRIRVWVDEHDHAFARVEAELLR
jgi:hypothetical protein